jgi:hypothetical protein
MKRNVIFSVLVVCIACAASRAAQPFTRIASPDPTPYRGFGWSVSLDGPTAIVSANNGAYAGKAYVYRDNGHGNWSKTATIVPSDSHINDKFGWSTSLSGSNALIGAPRFGSNGAAYVFEENDEGDWSQVAKLMPTGAINANEFGCSTSISNSTAIVGAYSENRFNGAAYVFEKDELGTWNQIVRLQPTGAVGLPPEFGVSVSLSGTTAIVGALTDNNLVGAAYIFRDDGYGTWNQVARIIPDGITDQSDFGSSVSLDGKTALIGAPWLADRSGAAFVFREDELGNWSQVAALVPNGIHAGKQFGWSVSLSGSTALIGSYSVDGPSNAYLFREDELGNWTQVAALTGEHNSTGDAFGFAVDLSSEYVLVSDIFDMNSGAVYLFQIPEPATYILAALTVVFISIRRKMSYAALKWKNDTDRRY